MPERYPGYDVLNKRNSPSWNDQTRRAIDERLAIDPDEHQFFADMEWPTPEVLDGGSLGYNSAPARSSPSGLAGKRADRSPGGQCVRIISIPGMFIVRRSGQMMRTTSHSSPLEYWNFHPNRRFKAHGSNALRVAFLLPSFR